MSEMKHTAGPWHAIHYPIEGGASGPAISVVQGPEILHRDRYAGFSAADANLLAAAPDLLAALQHLRSRLDEKTCSHECELIDAAIAKAQGRQP